MDPMIDRIGGEVQVHLLVNHFYDLIETCPRGPRSWRCSSAGTGLPMFVRHSLAFSAASSAGGATIRNAMAT